MVVHNKTDSADLQSVPITISLRFYIKFYILCGHGLQIRAINCYTVAPIFKYTKPLKK